MDSAPSSASARIVVAMKVLVMLPATNGVSTPTCTGGSSDDWPLTPAQRLPSGMITAADMPGTLLSIRMRSRAPCRSMARSALTALGDDVAVAVGVAAGLATAVVLGL